MADDPAVTAPALRVPLRAPVEVPGVGTVSELAFRVPRLGDLKGVRIRITTEGVELDTSDLFLIASRLAGVPLSVIEGLGLDDLAAAGAVIGPLSSMFPKTGSA